LRKGAKDMGKQPNWVADDCPDASGFITIRLADGTENGNTEVWPIATVYRAKDADRIVRACNSHADLLAALEGLVGEIHLSKLNIRKDFSLINAHACATKAIYKAKGGK